MKVNLTIDPGICNFPVEVTAESEDGMNVHLAFKTGCETLAPLLECLKEMMPMDAYQTLGKEENPILAAARSVLVAKGCCEACVVPAGLCKAMYVAANLALPRNISMEIVKAGG